MMNADGTDPHNVTNNPAEDEAPMWLPDGSKIVFYSSRSPAGYYAMNPDGSNPVRLDQIPADAYELDWSPDGGRVTFTKASQIWVMNADGSNQVQLTRGSRYEYGTPAWSPDGRKIAYTSYETESGYGFSEVFAMDADGGNPTNLTNEGFRDLDYAPAWSPDGSKIAYFTYDGGSFGGISSLWDIFVMNADGSNQTPLTRSQYLQDDDPQWSPRP
jgi:Tol biopolymer transport system component